MLTALQHSAARFTRMVVLTAAATAMTGCVPALHDPDRITPTAALSFSVATLPGSVTRSVSLEVFYRAATGRMNLLTLQRSVEPGTVQLPLVVDIGSCLNDATRIPLSEACSLYVGIVARNSEGALVDSTTIGPLAAIPGATIAVPRVALAVPSTIAFSLPDTLRVNDSLAVAAVLRDSTGAILTGRAVMWESSNPSIATVNALGVLRALRAGVVSVTATSLGARALVQRTVLADVRTVAITLRDTLRYLDTVTVTAVLRDRNGAVVTGVPVRFSSDDTLRARIDTTGLLTVLQAGTVNITATATGRVSSVVRTLRPEGISKLFANYNYVCGVGDTGRGYCWSRGTGQAGYSADMRLRPTAIPSDSAIVAISGGAFFNCGLTRSGRLMCASVNGGNTSGAMAVGDLLPRVKLTLAAGANVGPFVELAAGGNQTCARDAAGRVFCAGNALRVGFPATADQTTLGQVSLPAGVTLARIDGPGINTCGVASGTAGVYCWGIGARNNTSSAPFGAPVTSADFSQLPVLLNLGGAQVAHFNPGNTTSCYVVLAGDAFCYGSNSGGALGVGDTLSRTTPTRVVAPPGVRFVEVRGSTAGLVCARSTDQRVFCWGFGNTGGLGNGATQNSSIPVQVALPVGVIPTALVSTNGTACIETADRTPWCWGLNAGDGTANNRNVPVRVLLPGQPLPP
ncbi:Ig-like domain-containing protein [Gemmatimonas sp.]|jgi:hypothetical protein|uniref:Ig-like domain-containing protein n=1 Tax=Gemmatimonas sp. TaxID=1962908 RepID=UPI0037C0170F